MPLRSLLFCCDAEAAQPLVRVLAELHIDAEVCPNAVIATERVTSQPFQIVILDWDDQPNAGLVLKAARTRKASQRPLTLAMVGDDAGVPQALQAGANSVLRKPVLADQARDILTTARDLLRAKVEQSTSPSTPRTLAAKAPAGASRLDPSPASTTLRAGEFLQSSSPQPGAQFTTESDLEKRLLHSQPPAAIDPLQDLEPMASALDAKSKSGAASIPPANQPRGLAWYKALNASAPGSAAAPAPATAPPSYPGKPELLSYEQTPSFSTNSTSVTAKPAGFAPQPSSIQTVIASSQGGHAAESQALAWLAGEPAEHSQLEHSQVESAQPAPRASSPNLARRGLAWLFCAAAIAAGVAYGKLPPSLWQPRLQRVSTRVTAAVHAWLNPQPLTPAQAPTAHENFGRAGDEYKLPVAEAIPDATTDPSQIRVLPIIDPTAKHPNPADANQTAGADAPTAQGLPNPSPVSTPQGAPLTSSPVTAGLSAAPPATQSSTQPAAQASSTAAARPNVTPAASPRNLSPQYAAASAGVPSSLKSQLATSTPEASGNKSPDAALPSIEPVTLAEVSARNLLQQQPAPVYPESARGQSGTVVLQVLLGRDGTVQDAKFLQGSLVFARAAIDAVKQWHFQPYTMNGRPVSVLTSLTISFKPAS